MPNIHTSYMYYLNLSIMRQVLFSNANPTPTGLTHTFKSPSDGLVTFTVYGSCFAIRPQLLAYLVISINGKIVAEPGIFANVAQQHMTVTPAVFQLDLPGGPNTDQTITIAPYTASTQVDSNDQFTVVIDY